MEIVAKDLNPDALKITRRLAVGSKGMTEQLADQLKHLARLDCKLCGGSGVSGWRNHGMTVEICKCAYPAFCAAVREAVRRQKAAKLGEDSTKQPESGILGADGRPARDSWIISPEGVK